MKKRAKGEKVEPWRQRLCEPPAKELGTRLAAWADTVRKRARDYFPEMPEGVEDRDADVWEALISVADMAGGDWPQMAREAAQHLVRESREAGGESYGVLLLTDLKAIFDVETKLDTPTKLKLKPSLTPKAKAKNGKAAMQTKTLLRELKDIPESPWKSFGRGKDPIEARGLSRLLKPYGIAPRDIRWDDGSVAKGYLREDLEDAWTRYVPTAIVAVAEAVAEVVPINGGAHATVVPYPANTAVADA